MRRLRIAGLTALALLSTGCPAADDTPTSPSGGAGTPTTPTTPSTPSTPTTPATPVVAVASVGVTAPALVLEVGKTLGVAAVARDAGGATLAGRPVTWTSGTAAVATVDAGGTVRGVAPGTTTITADVEGKSASVTITVYATPTGSVALAAAAPTVVGTVTAQTGLGVLACTFKWTATVTGNASVTAVENTYTVQAPDGTPTTRTEAITSSSGGALALSSASAVTFQKGWSWQSILGSAAAQQGFTVTLAMTYVEQPAGTRRATAPIVLTCQPPGAAAVGVGVSPGTASLTVGQTQPLTATVTNAVNTAVTWSTSTAAVATVSSLGVVTAVAPGTATITATSSADPTKSASATITVTSASTPGAPGTPGTPTGSVSFASARLLTPPNPVAGEQPAAVTATNAGVYIEYVSETRTRVARFQSGASLTTGWSVFAPAFDLADFHPASLTLERPNTFTGYWVQSVFSCNFPNGEKAGLYVLNTGVPSTEWRNDVCATAMIPSSSEQTTLAHTWLVASAHGSVSQPLGGFYVEQAAKSATGGLSGDYKRVAALVDYTSAATSPKDNALWVAGLDKLYEIAESGATRTYDLSAFGPGMVEGLRFQGETLWFSYAGKVTRLQNGTFRQFGDVAITPGIGRQFCVQGTTIYVAGGTRIDATTGASRTYLADREIAQIASPADVKTYLDLMQKTVGSLDCSTVGTTGVLYVATSTGVYEITAK